MLKFEKMDNLGASEQHKAKKGPSKEESHTDDEEVDSNHDLTKNTPLLWAAFKGHLRIVWLLLQDGYSPDDTDNLKNNAIHLSAASGHTKVLQCLIDDGGNANAVNTYKNVPLYMATDPIVQEMLTVAMEKGASMTKAQAMAKHEQNMRNVRSSSADSFFIP